MDLYTTVVRAIRFQEGNSVRSLMCAALLAASATCVALVATSQQAQTASQEGVQQQSYQDMTPAQRAAATRTFLGLGAAPDKAAAARGEPLFVQSCAFCHGPTAHGATGPSLITSDLVLADDHGEHLTPFLKAGSPQKGMPAFAGMSDQQLSDIAEFLHLQIEEVANRGTYEVLNILVGNTAKGEAYMASHCMSCHTHQTFAHIARQFRSPEQLQRYWIWPARDRHIAATVRTPDGTISGQVIQVSDFRITLSVPPGGSLAVERGPGVEVQLTNPLAAHEEMVMTLANDDMHNVTAYLETLK
jgi:cytochrome c oxidase cbb3-type subunit III